MNFLNVACFWTMALTFCLASDLKDKLWEKYKETFKKEYESSEHEDKHREHFEKNLVKVAEHNVGYDLGVHTYKMAPHNFSDQPHHEALAKLCGTKVPSNFSSRARETFVASSRANLPSSVDWTKNGRVTSVKNQGNCGSCWSFAATGAIEGQLVRQGYSLTDLSQQQLVDCSKKNNACNGGWPDTAFQYAIDNGIETLSDYKYTAKKESCKYKKAKVFVKVDDYFNIESGDETAVAQALHENGPLSVAIHVNDNFMNYKAGVYDEVGCSDKVNHGVLVVGYGSENGKDYWIVKNSWGSGWGEKGFIRMTRNKSNQCAIASYASWPNVIKKS